MAVRPSVLCPVDFSYASRGALRYAAALAEHFYAALTVLAVDDPLLTATVNARVADQWLEQQTRLELERFVRQAFPGRTPQVAELHLLQAIGNAAEQILRVAGETHADAIVMSTHGTTGVRKMFGSTTERVLRETPLPVIITPATDPGPESVEDWRRTVKTLLVPVDLSDYTATQLQVARGLAEALDTGLVLMHVVEPLPRRPGSEHLSTHADAARRAHACRRLEQLGRTLPPRLMTTTVISAGDAATEIARAAKEHGTGAIVMGLHSAPGTNRQMGTVTYRVLCQTPALVVAWPPSRRDTRLALSHSLATAVAH